MGRIKDTGEKISKKLSLEDYNTNIGCSPTGSEMQGGGVAIVEQIPIDSKTVRQQAGKKKMTFYLDKETETKLNEVYSRKLMKNEKVDKSALIVKAINLLWTDDKQYDI